MPNTEVLNYKNFIQVFILHGKFITHIEQLYFIIHTVI